VKSPVSQALLKDGFGHLPVQRQALGLPVFFIPAQVEPSQAFEDRGERGLGVALHVGVVDAQDHDTAVMAGVEPVKDEGARASYVQKARGRRRKANSEHGNASITSLTGRPVAAGAGAGARGRGPGPGAREQNGAPRVSAGKRLQWFS